MSHKSIAITIGSLEEMGKEFISVWHEVEEGKVSKLDPVEKIFFKDEALFFKTLTVARFNLLRKLSDLGSSSIRALSKELHRDYKNVFEDVKALHQIDLIIKNDDGKYCVPWESVITEIPIKKTRNFNNKKSGSHLTKISAENGKSDLHKNHSRKKRMVG